MCGGLSAGEAPRESNQRALCILHADIHTCMYVCLVRLMWRLAYLQEQQNMSVTSVQELSNISVHVDVK